MNNSARIILIGANGSGKSTLGRELARLLSIAHFDAEDYYFYKTDVPYTVERPPIERNSMLFTDMYKCGSYVVSGDVSGWDDKFLSLFELAVLLSAPVDVRMRRIEEREFTRWGERVNPDGDMYESQMRFREFAKTRDIGALEQAALRYRCPIIRLDNAGGLRDAVETIITELKLRGVI
jgi:adenylate kinase family enzyme